MYASVSVGKIFPGKEKEFVTLWNEKTKPVVEGLPGIIHTYVLVNAETDEAMVVALYESREDAERTQSSGDYQRAVGEIAAAIDLGSVKRSGYDVAVAV